MEVLTAVEPLNAFLCAMHGPSESVAATMRGLVPFPAALISLPDADLLDLNVLVCVDPSAPQTATVEAWARYATGARAGQVRSFYLDALRQASAATTDTFVSGPTSMSATLSDAAATQCSVSFDAHDGYRSVKLEARYRSFDYRQLFARFADWHDGRAPVTTSVAPTGVEISTFAVGRRPNTLVLYSTLYDCESTPCAERRMMVDDRFDELGVTYHEPREGIMFLQDDQFAAETHVEGDERSSSVKFVGEFQLR